MIFFGPVPDLVGMLPGDPLAVGVFVELIGVLEERLPDCDGIQVPFVLGKQADRRVLGRLVFSVEFQHAKPLRPGPASAASFVGQVGDLRPVGLPRGNCQERELLVRLLGCGASDSRQRAGVSQFHSRRIAKHIGSRRQQRGHKH